MRLRVFVNSVVERIAKTGKKYWSIETSEGKFNCFDFELSLALKDRVNQVAYLTYTEKNGFKNVTAFDLDNATPVRSAAPTLPVADVITIKDRLIIRQSCLKAAIEFTSGAAEVLKCAEDFEAWVCRGYDGKEETEIEPGD